MLEISEEQLAKATERTIAAARNAGPEAHATGRCLSCSTPLADRRWCDAGCRDDWERARGPRR